MSYTVYIRNAGEWMAWSVEISYADAVREMEYLVRYENVEAMIA